MPTGARTTSDFSVSEAVDTFAHSVGQTSRTHARADRWAPGRATSDHDGDQTRALERLGWFDLATEGDDGLAFVGAGAVELGRLVSPFVDVLALLGGSPSSSSGLAMYVGALGRTATLGQDGLHLASVTDSQPVNFADSLDVHLVRRTSDGWRPESSDTRVPAWESATAGYLAGLAAGAVEKATDHARNREAFGKTLGQIETVQQRLADAATVAEALCSSAREGGTGTAALAYAATTVAGVMAHCHQVVGAIGFTLEYPMQRYSRRARAIAAFAQAWVDQRLEMVA